MLNDTSSYTQLSFVALLQKHFYFKLYDIDVFFSFLGRFLYLSQAFFQVFPFSSLERFWCLERSFPCIFVFLIIFINHFYLCLSFLHQNVFYQTLFHQNFFPSKFFQNFFIRIFLILFS